VYIIDNSNKYIYEHPGVGTASSTVSLDRKLWHRAEGCAALAWRGSPCIISSRCRGELRGIRKPITRAYVLLAAQARRGPARAKAAAPERRGLSKRLGRGAAKAMDATRLDC
jgi:hypothetical protein